MIVSLKNRILSRISSDDLVGREAEIAEIVRHCTGGGSLLIRSTPGAGTTEVLYQTYDRIFRSSTGAIPIYFSFDQPDHSINEVAARFFRDLILQINAFRRQDPRLLHSALTMREIVQRTTAKDANTVNGLIKYFGRRQKNESDEDLSRKVFNAPIRAVAAGIPLIVIFDAVHTLARFDEGERLLVSLRNAFSESPVPHIFAGHRRSLQSSGFDRVVPLERLSFADTGRATEGFAQRCDVAINDETRDLITIQFGHNLRLIEEFIRSADGRSLDSFQKVQQHYAREMVDGRLRRYFDTVLSEIVPSNEIGTNIVGMLRDTAEFGYGTIGKLTWTKESGMDESVADRVLKGLNEQEFVSLADGQVEMRPADVATRDYLTTRFRLEVAGESRAATIGRSTVQFIKRAPELMARFYRSRNSIGIREILAGFGGEMVPHALIDYSKFANEYKGAPDAEILRDVGRAEDNFHLPNIVFAAHTSAIYEPLNKVTDSERSAVGFGFAGESEMIWIAAEIDSKLETAADHAEFWCDRLEMAALMCGLSPYRIWLISPEGFSPDAQQILRRRNVIGSSKKQVDLLRQFLKNPRTAGPNIEEFEITLPMDENAELVAASVVEEIARRHNFDAKAINQIKTALIEAFINAAEHSLSPDRKVHQRFTVDARGLTVTISNRGLRLTDTPAPTSDSDKQRRGWGLELMRRLMDEVSIEATDDGARISMTKYLHQT